MKRLFTVQALLTCDLLSLSMNDLDMMKTEFTDVYFELINDAKENVQKCLNDKNEEI
jgi:hypothetical protein